MAQASRAAHNQVYYAIGKKKFASQTPQSYSAKQARKGKDIGKPGKQFAKIAASAGRKYGSRATGERVAGAVLANLRKKRA